MRILLVTTWYPSAVAPGSGVFVRKDAELLAGGHDVHVIHLGSPGLLTEADVLLDRAGPVRVTRIPMSTTRPWEWRRAWHAVRPYLGQADVLHTQAFSALLPFVGRRSPLPWIHTEHWSALSNPETVGRAGRALLPVLGRLLRKPDVVTTVCEYLAAPARKLRGRGVRVVPCIVPPATEVVPPPGDLAAPRLVAVGGLLDRKDPLCALDTLAILRAGGVDATLTWVGDGPLRETMLARAQAIGAADSLTITGVRDAGGVIAALQEADVFLLPTKGENFCVSAAEAIVHGRPVVVGANGGQREYVEERNGRLVADRSAEAYAAAVRELLDRRRPSPAAIAATIGDRFSPETVAAGYEAAYREAIERRDDGH